MNQCHHGQLARSCERCDDAAEIAGLHAQRRELQAERERLLEQLAHAGLEARRAVMQERERCKRIVQINQIRNGHHTHEGTKIGHYDVRMIAEIESGLPPKH